MIRHVLPASTLTGGLAASPMLACSNHWTIQRSSDASRRSTGCSLKCLAGDHHQHASSSTSPDAPLVHRDPRQDRALWLPPDVPGAASARRPRARARRQAPEVQGRFCPASAALPLAHHHPGGPLRGRRRRGRRSVAKETDDHCGAEDGAQDGPQHHRATPALQDE